MQNLQFLIFDEADRLIGEETMRPDLKDILQGLPKARQTFLFSATMMQNYEDKLPKALIFGDETCEVIELGNSQAANEEFQMTVQRLDQNLVFIPENVKEAYLIFILKLQALKKQ